MDDSNTTLKDLIAKYIAGTCTKEDLDVLLQMVQNEENKEELSQVLKNHWNTPQSKKDELPVDLESRFSQIMQEAKYIAPLVTIEKNRIKRKWTIHYAAAAIIIWVFSIGAYVLFIPAPKKEISKTGIVPLQELAPGGNKAILTLADGSSIILDSAENGTLTTQGNIKILKLDGKLSYNKVNKAHSGALYNTISTPRGGQYQLVLSDGTKVWLNAASSLRFPATFTGKERKVELHGEAYFEVAKNASMPFKVEVNETEVEVLGTHFNINSYEDESAMRTTLLEGSVKINKNHTSSLLKPGQQAQINKEGVVNIVKNVDVMETVAWKEGNFQFDRDDIYSVMRQIARWYNVEVEYRGTVSSHFVGTILRSVNLSQVLDMLHLTGEVKFEVKDRKIIVTP